MLAARLRLVESCRTARKRIRLADPDIFVLRVSNTAAGLDKQRKRAALHQASLLQAFCSARKLYIWR